MKDERPDGLHSYVYELIDPRTDIIFYVGCGGSSRVRTSGTVACSIHQPEKCARIKEIRADGFKPIVRIVSAHLSREEALEAEANHYERLTLVDGLELTNKQRWSFVPKPNRSDFCSYEIVDPVVGVAFHVGCNYATRVKANDVLAQLRTWKAKHLQAIKKAGLEPVVRVIGEYKSFPEATRSRNNHRDRLKKEGLLLTEASAPKHQPISAVSAWCGHPHYRLRCPTLPRYCVPSWQPGSPD